MEMMVVMVETLVLTTLVVAVEQVVKGGQAYAPVPAGAAGGHGGAGVTMPGFEYPLIGLSSYTPDYQILQLITIMVVVVLDGDIQLQPQASNYKELAVVA